MKVEYRVVPVTRYIVTRYTSGEAGENSGSVAGRGEYENADTAYEVGYALCRAEHERLGYRVDDERVTYPQHPHTAMACADLSATA